MPAVASGFGDHEHGLVAVSGDRRERPLEIADGSNGDALDTHAELARGLADHAKVARGDERRRSVRLEHGEAREIGDHQFQQLEAFAHQLMKGEAGPRKREPARLSSPIVATLRACAPAVNGAARRLALKAPTNWRRLGMAG